ncbi:hypothetical protein KAU45_01725, partial [bacterium]|nr:hypothetical protein [bacterium]
MTHDINALYLTLTDTYIDNAVWPGGDGSDLLCTGHLALGVVDQLNTSDSWDLETEFYGDDDWPTEVPWGDIPLPYGDENYLVYMTDENNPYNLGLKVRQQSFGFGHWPDGDYICILWTVFNTSGRTLEDLAVGLYMDMDVGVDCFDDLAVYRSVNQFAYMYNDTSWGAEELYFGAVTLGDAPAGSFHGWTIYEDFHWNPQAYYYGMLSQVGRFQDLPDFAFDWRFLLGYQLYDLAPGQTRDYAVALVAGEDLQDIIANVLAARIKWQELFGGEAPEPSIEPRIVLSAPWPCPVQDSARFNVELAEGGYVEVALYDVSGRRVDTVYEGHMTAG